MLARSRKITIGGRHIETPLLVPAISSKALGPIEHAIAGSTKLVPASLHHTETLIGSIAEATLISAYDIVFEHVVDAADFTSNFGASRYAGINTIFLDSGWYEMSTTAGTGPWYFEAGTDGQTFDIEEYGDFLDRLAPEAPIIAVSWDLRGSYEDQISAAQAFLGARRVGSDILLKPPSKRRRLHDFDQLSVAIASRLAAFDVVGVTEKELGDTVLQRLVSLGELRTILDKAGVSAPIHVFGGLDPLTTPLYFAVGAEIFDGLSWLRYGYHNGVCVHQESLCILEGRWEKRLAVAASHVQLSNLDAIQDLSRELKEFLYFQGDWLKVHNGEVLSHAYEAWESVGGHHGR